MASESSSNSSSSSSSCGMRGTKRRRGGQRACGCSGGGVRSPVIGDDSTRDILAYPEYTCNPSYHDAITTLPAIVLFYALPISDVTHKPPVGFVNADGSVVAQLATAADTHHARIVPAFAVLSGLVIAVIRTPVEYANLLRFFEHPPCSASERNPNSRLSLPPQFAFRVPFSPFPISGMPALEVARRIAAFIKTATLEELILRVVPQFDSNWIFIGGSISPIEEQSPPLSSCSGSVVATLMSRQLVDEGKATPTQVVDRVAQLFLAIFAATAVHIEPPLPHRSSL